MQLKKRTGMRRSKRKKKCKQPRSNNSIDSNVVFMANCAKTVRGREEKSYKKQINKNAQRPNPNMQIDIKIITLSCMR